MKEQKYCPYCRADIVAGQKFCVTCGKQIPEVPVSDIVETHDSVVDVPIAPSEPVKKNNILAALIIVVIVAAAYGVMYAFRDKCVAAAYVNAKKTPDMSMLYLKGPVKAVIVLRRNKGEDEWMESATYEFDEDGNLTSYPGWPVPYTISYEYMENGMVTSNGGNPVERDTQGRIVSLSGEGGEFGDYGIRWDYDNDVFSEFVGGYYTTTHVVAKNKGKLPQTVEIEQSGRGVTENWKQEYTYTDFDSYGNYVSATYSEEHKIYYDDLDTEETDTLEGEEWREITYYK